MAVATDYHLFWKGDLMVLEWKIAAFILLTSSPDFRLFRDSILCRAESFIEHELSTVLGLRESVKQAQLFSGVPSCLSQMFLKSAVCLTCNAQLHMLMMEASLAAQKADPWKKI